MIFVLSPVIGQTRDADMARIDSVLSDTKTAISENLHQLYSQQRYKLYPTENIYTFLQLDTQTGMIDQVQWSLDKEKEGTLPINKVDLSLYDYVSGRFELYPTKNMYQFILLDTRLGFKWHVQWGMKATERWIRRIF